ncbi:hypothetical protein AL036_04880 [Salipiger aestuarii]|uniref:Uncharacterized protein n=1 Tax=Salipiger aestuarii TaxID=568098 RepID=A0A327YKR1_9RHOB|nr:hypothetical protein [Salipiger aestuarii]KAA8609055.1 hypothetical protein AL036_04880 [Salipiger aestuarii]KAB2542747.1 hypothetical protein AL035_05155 [Salipiger aestuarii]RAK20315.1 hypothetical protein ATI53_100693 [Salipiger aestuarii]
MQTRFCHFLDALMIVAALVCGIGSTFAAALGPMPDRAGDVVLVIAPPWSVGAAALVLRAGGQPVGPFSAPFGTLAVFDTAPPVSQLVSLGAWTVRDARFISSICGVSG